MDLKYVLLFLLIIPCVSGSIRINEVMADPDPCPDAYCEYIELYNDGNSPVNLSGWIIGDGQENDTLEWDPAHGNGSTMIPAKGYAIITDKEKSGVYENFSVSMESIKLHINDNAIAYLGLLNTGETLYLYNKNNDSIDSFSYYSTYAGLSCSFDNETIWCKSEPTPGYFNQGSFLDFFTGACDWYIDLILNKTSFRDDFEFRVNVRKNGGGKSDVTLIREVRDVYGNVVSGYSPLTKFLTYGSNFGGPWSPNYNPGAYLIETCIETNCNEVRLNNNCDSKYFIIEGDEPEDNSSIKFGRVYDLGSDNIARFGQIIKVKVDAYKGDTSKESIILHVESDDGQRVSKDSKVNVEDKFSNYSLTIPIQLIPNCGGKFNEGTYYIIGEGLGDRDKEEVEISGTEPSLCEVVKEVKEVYKEENESVLNGEYITGSVVYEGEEQGTYAVYFFCFSLIALILYLLIKNE